MKTNTAPWDYEKRVVIVSRLTRLCEKCGNHVVAMPDGVRCITCKHTGFVEVWEHMAEAFRRGLWEIETEKALALVELLDEQMPTFGGTMELGRGTK
jgi:hypothetical protein